MHVDVISWRKGRQVSRLSPSDLQVNGYQALEKPKSGLLCHLRLSKANDNGQAWKRAAD